MKKKGPTQQIRDYYKVILVRSITFQRFWWELREKWNDDI